MVIADSWYQSPIWVPAGVLVGAVFGFGGMWAVLYAANPRRRLEYGISTMTRLIRTGRISGTIEVHRNGLRVNDPHVLTLTITNRGRHDISKADFEESHLSFDVGQQVLEILEVKSKPDGYAIPTVRDHDFSVLIGPNKIGKGQQIDISVLIDGPGVLSKPDNPLVDVELRERMPKAPSAQVTQTAIIVAAIASLAAVATLFTTFTSH